MKHLIILAIALIAVVALVIPTASATVSVYMENLTEETWASSLLDGTAINQSLGKSFAGNDQYLYNFSILMQNNSVTESGTIRALLFKNVTDATHAGIYHPNTGAAAIAYSTNLYNFANLVGETWVEFTFDSNIRLNSTESYCIGINVTVAGGTTIQWGQTSTGNSWYTATLATGFYAHNSVSPCYQIFTTDSVGDFTEATATPGPLPTGGSYDTSDTDALISALFGYLVPLLTFLLPALILGWVTRWEKWPIMIGLAIGAGLTYLFLGSGYVWLVFLVAVGLAGMV